MNIATSPMHAQPGPPTGQWCGPFSAPGGPPLGRLTHLSRLSCRAPEHALASRAAIQPEPSWADAFPFRTFATVSRGHLMRAIGVASVGSESVPVAGGAAAMGRPTGEPVSRPTATSVSPVADR